MEGYFRSDIDEKVDVLSGSYTFKDRHTGDRLPFVIHADKSGDVFGERRQSGFSAGEKAEVHEIGPVRLAALYPLGPRFMGEHRALLAYGAGDDPSSLQHAVVEEDLGLRVDFGRTACVVIEPEDDDVARLQAFERIERFPRFLGHREREADRL